MYSKNETLQLSCSYIHVCTCIILKILKDYELIFDIYVDTGAGMEVSVGVFVILLSWAGGDGDTVGVGVVSDMGGGSSSFAPSYSSLISNVII